MKKLNELINKLECYPIEGRSTLCVDVIIVERKDLEDAIYYLKKYENFLKKSSKFFIFIYKYIKLYFREIRDSINGNLE